MCVKQGVSTPPFFLHATHPMIYHKCQLSLVLISEPPLRFILLRVLNSVIEAALSMEDLLCRVRSVNDLRARSDLDLQIHVRDALSDLRNFGLEALGRGSSPGKAIYLRRLLIQRLESELARTSSTEEAQHRQLRFMC